MLMQQTMKWLGAGLVLGAFTLMTPAAEARAGLDGKCTATGDFVTGTKADGPFTLDATDVGSATVVIPRSDTVNWSGSVDVPAVARAYSGSITLKLPPGFGEFTLHSWSSTSDRVENSGVEEYKLPSLLPAGVTFVVTGKHVEDATTCSGTINVKIEGGAFDSPVAPVSLGLTAAAGAGFVAAIRPLFRRVV